MKMSQQLKSNKGITLMTLTLTIVIMLILTFTVSVNVSTYVERNNKINLETDITKLKEAISTYYSKNKILPVINKYTNTEMLTTNMNDNENYYIIDLIELRKLDLNYGRDYEKVNNKEESISNLTDIYIINEQSHTIYYPRGVKYNNEVIYTTMSLGQIKIENIPISEIKITGANAGKVGEEIKLKVKIIPEFIENTGIIWSSSDENLATVTEEGKVTLIKEGVVTITAISKDDNSIKEIHVIDILGA